MRSVLRKRQRQRIGVARDRVAAVGERADPLERRRHLVRQQRHRAHPRPCRARAGIVARRVAHLDRAGEHRQPVPADRRTETRRARDSASRGVEYGAVGSSPGSVAATCIPRAETTGLPSRSTIVISVVLTVRPLRDHGGVDAEPGVRYRSRQVDRQAHELLVGEQPLGRPRQQPGRRAGVASVRVPWPAAVVGRPKPIAVDREERGGHRPTLMRPYSPTARTVPSTARP